MASIRKLKSGNYQAIVYVTEENGERKNEYFTAPTKREALAKAREFELVKEDRKLKGATVQEAIKEYIENKSAILSPSTVVMYKSILRNKLKDIMPLRVLTLTANDVQLAINKEAVKSSPKTVRNIYGLLSASIGVYNVHFNIALPQKKKYSVFIPTHADIQKLMCAVKGTQLELPVMLASVLGLRRSEVFALEWSDVDFENSLMYVNKAIVANEYNEYVLKTTKTPFSTRIVPIPEHFLKVLETHKGEGKVCTIKSPQMITWHFRKTTKELFGHSFRFHDLRHYTASVMLALGVPDKYAMKIMGHATNNMLKNVYQHTFEEKEKEVHKTIGDFYNNLI